MNAVDNVNSVILEGYLTRDTKIREPKAGFRIATFPVATNRVYRRANGQLMGEISYFDIESRGDWVDYCRENGMKGAAARVVGHLRQDHWKDQGGGFHSKVWIVAEHIELKPSSNATQSWAEAVKTHDAARAGAEAANYASAARAQHVAQTVEYPQEDAVF